MVVDEAMGVVETESACCSLEVMSMMNVALKNKFCGTFLDLCLYLCQSLLPPSVCLLVVHLMCLFSKWSLMEEVSMWSVVV